MSRWKDLHGELREVAQGVFHGAEPLDEAEHFYACAHCRQAVDMRELADVLHHDKPDHTSKPAQQGDFETPDNLDSRGPQHRARINLNEEYEIRNWSARI